MSRSKKAKIRQAHADLDMAREFKNDALEDRKYNFGGYYEDRFQMEKDHFKGVQKQLRKLKKYNGATGLMTEKNYMELMGA